MKASITTVPELKIEAYTGRWYQVGLMEEEGGGGGDYDNDDDDDDSV